jgi:hypothetical protein
MDATTGYVQPMNYQEALEEIQRLRECLSVARVVRVEINPIKYTTDQQLTIPMVFTAIGIHEEAFGMQVIAHIEEVMRELFAVAEAPVAGEGE